MTNRNDRRRLVSFYERVHRALAARPAAGAFDIERPDEAAALMAMTLVSVRRQQEGHEPDALEEIRTAAKIVETVAFATSVPREQLKTPGKA